MGVRHADFRDDISSIKKKISENEEILRGIDERNSDT